jgi:hypothetical protein
MLFGGRVVWKRPVIEEIHICTALRYDSNQESALLGGKCLIADAGAQAVIHNTAPTNKRWSAPCRPLLRSLLLEEVVNARRIKITRLLRS